MIALTREFNAPSSDARKVEDLIRKQISLTNTSFFF
jgi:hypothetical protein